MTPPLFHLHGFGLAAVLLLAGAVAAAGAGAETPAAPPPPAASRLALPVTPPPPAVAATTAVSAATESSDPAKAADAAAAGETAAPAPVEDVRLHSGLKPQGLVDFTIGVSYGSFAPWDVRRSAEEWDRYRFSNSSCVTYPLWPP